MIDLRTYYAGYRLRLIKLEQARLEMRARHWIKGEHGYFAGSYSTGGGGKTSAKAVDKAGESGIMKSGEFHCYGDYLRDIMGSAKDNNPEELEAIKKDVEEKGGKLILLKDNTKMVTDVYQGEPGVIKVDENISLAGLKHEYRHFLDDLDNGCPGLAYYLKDKDAFFDFERRGYEEEIKIAQKIGAKDAEKKIRGEIKKRRKEIYGE